ncbi:hypothetical protein K7432_003997 [Basidiobolus ranarum]|uniref:Uncharacterized protein n=1 Tax=Basidiobolus ranarum TaxID=34480 RepID=A0ABR2WZ05_9FUNG
MNVDRINELLNDINKPIVESPPPYSTVVSDRKAGLETLETFSTTPKRNHPETPVKDTLMLDKMVHLESLCSSMQTMLEFQTFAYKDVKTHLSEINKSINRLDVREPSPPSTPTPQASQKSNELLLENSSILEPNCEEVVESSFEESSGEDTGYGRVCDMLDHLLNDAKAAISTEPPLEVSYSEDLDEELASSASLITPIRQKLREEIEKEQLEASSQVTSFKPPLPDKSVKKNTTELRFWCQVVSEGQEQEPYQIQRKLVLPTLTPRKRNSTQSMRSFTSADDNGGQVSLTEPEGTVGIYDQSKTVISMIYWTLLFTLGALLLDRYLIELASAQVANAMEHISPDRQVEFTELSDAESDDEETREIEYQSEDSEVETPLRRRRIRRYSM